MAGQAAGTYLSVRFGNVLGSRGSVLTALSAQVAAGGPVTVTHPGGDPVLHDRGRGGPARPAGGRRSAADGEVLVLDMGEPVRIADIARQAGRAGRAPVDIVFTGLRPGEKLTEDLLGQGEVDNRPHHPLIRHAGARRCRQSGSVAWT